MIHSTDILFWLDIITQLSQRICMVLMAAFVSIRVAWLREALRGDGALWRNRIISILFFGTLAVIGTHGGYLVDLHDSGYLSKWPTLVSNELKQFQTVIGFRSLMVLTAGLIGGPCVGFGAGLIAGAERYLLGGFSSTASAFGSVAQGLFAGLVVQRKPHWATRLRTAGLIALAGAIIHILILLVFVKPYEDALALVLKATLPVAGINTIGVLLFLIVMRDLERDRLENQAVKAELRALSAQIEPHFMNGAMNAIKVLICENPEVAQDYVVKMARFLSGTLKNAGANSITLENEINQVKRYLEFQSLRFPGVFHVHYEVPPRLFGLHIPSHALLTIAENALLHGMRSRAVDLLIGISIKGIGHHITICVHDNGGGISSKRLAELGKRPLDSLSGNGQALYYLQKSLKLAFPKQASMKINSQEGQGTEVILTIPKRSEPW